MKIIDLTYDINTNMPHFKGDPVPEIRNVKSIDMDGYNVKELNIGTHTSTHVDAPSHFIKEGKSVDDLDPFSYSGFVQVVDASDREFIDEEIVKKVFMQKVFFYTGSNMPWDNMFEFDKFSYISEKAAKMLIGKNVNLVGIDSPSVEDPLNSEFPTHKTLLRNGALIIENLNSKELKNLVGKVIMVFAFPLRIRNGDGSPVRVICIEWDGMK